MCILSTLPVCSETHCFFACMSCWLQRSGLAVTCEQEDSPDAELPQKPTEQQEEYVSCPSVIAWQKRLQQRYMAAPKSRTGDEEELAGSLRVYPGVFHVLPGSENRLRFSAWLFWHARIACVHADRVFAQRICCLAMLAKRKWVESNWCNGSQTQVSELGSLSHSWVVQMARYKN